MNRPMKKDKLVNLKEFSFQTYLLITISLLIMVLTILIVNILLNGIDKLSFNLITNYPSSDIEKAGMRQQY